MANKSKTCVTASIPDKLWRELKRAAAEDRRPMSNLMEILIEEGLQRRKSTETAKVEHNQLMVENNRPSLNQ